MENQQQPAEHTHATQPPQAPPRGPQTGWVPSPVETDPRRKSAPLACLLSLLPGLGQVYVGYYRLGFVHILVVASVITLLGNDMVRGAEPLFGIFLAFFYLYNVVDAGRRASFYNQALAGIEGVALPQDLRVPTGGGSLAAGAGLIVVGLVMLSHTVMGFSLAWVADWWPVVPIGVGANLLYQALAEKSDNSPARTVRGEE